MKNVSEAIVEREAFQLALQKKLKTTQVFDDICSLPYRFVTIFRENIVRNLFDNPQGQTFTRSDFTLRIAMAFRDASRTMRLNCRFEARGRHDGVLEEIGETPVDLLFAEWEWNHTDIFGDGKELDKLAKSVQSHEQTGAIIFTLCPEEKYLQLIADVTEFWQAQFKGEVCPVLSVMVLVFGKGVVVKFLNVVDIGSKAQGVSLREDYPV